MTQPARAAAAIDEAREAAFLDYLRDHPDFFARHEDALSRIAFTHGSGTAASLLERSTARLREQVGRLEAQLADLVEMARLNEVHARNLHKLAQALLQAADGDHAIQILQEAMARDFDIEATRVVENILHILRKDGLYLLASWQAVDLPVAKLRRVEPPRLLLLLRRAPLARLRHLSCKVRYRTFL